MKKKQYDFQKQKYPASSNDDEDENLAQEQYYEDVENGQYYDDQDQPINQNNVELEEEEPGFGRPNSESTPNDRAFVNNNNYASFNNHEQQLHFSQQQQEQNNENNLFSKNLQSSPNSRKNN